MSEADWDRLEESEKYLRERMAGTGSMVTAMVFRRCADTRSMQLHQGERDIDIDVTWQCVACAESGRVQATMVGSRGNHSERALLRWCDRLAAAASAHRDNCRGWAR